jgi:hypothetical protein
MAVERATLDRAALVAAVVVVRAVALVLLIRVVVVALAVTTLVAAAVAHGALALVVLATLVLVAVLVNSQRLPAPPFIVLEVAVAVRTIRLPVVVLVVAARVAHSTKPSTVGLERSTPEVAAVGRGVTMSAVVALVVVESSSCASRATPRPLAPV